MHGFLKGAMVFALGFILLTGTGLGQERRTEKYPSKPVSLIVSWPPGSGADITGRIVAAYASKKFGVPVNVVNISGASGITGMLQALNSRPDGYTLLLDNNTNSSFLYAVRSDLPMKLEERTYIARVAVDWVYFMANLDTGWKTFEEALKVLRSRPEEFRWGAAAYGSSPMFSQVDLFMAAGVDMDKIKKSKMVIFEKGNPAALQACVTGDVQFASGVTAELRSTLATGRIRPLVVNAPKRTTDFPDIPTAKELGYPEAKITRWFGITGPKGLPDSVVQRWDDVVKGGMNDREAQASAAKAMMAWEYMGGAEFQKYVLNEYQKAIPIARALGLKQ